jgi:hypothetical protein
MERTTASIDAFAAIVERAEAEADVRPKAELAGFQLQGLTGTLSALSAGWLPEDVDQALTVLRLHVAQLGGAADREAGANLRSKVAAYAVLAEDLELDAVRLEGLVARWDAIVERRPAVAGRRVTKAASKPTREATACPVCGEMFTRVGKHMSVAHRADWERDRAER